MGLKVKLKNAREFEARLERLGRKLIPDGLRKEVTDFSKREVLNMAKGVASSRGVLQKVKGKVSAKKQRGTSKLSTVVSFVIGSFAGKGAKGWSHALLRWNLFGTVARRTKDNENRGRIKRVVADKAMSAGLQGLNGTFMKKVNNAIDKAKVAP